MQIEITNFLKELLPALDDFFFLISQIGGEIFLIVLLLVLYWTHNKKDTVLASYILIAAIISNFWLKLVIANERPPSSIWHPSADPPNYSTPSGHAQNSATFYGWFTARTKTWWMTIIAIIMTVLIGISRVYIGVHFLGDVLLGWGIGIITVLLWIYLEEPARNFLSRYETESLLLVLMTIGFLMTLLAAVLPPPPNDNFGAIGGLTIGFALGLILETRFVDFSNEPYDGQKWRLVLRVLFGLVFIIGVMAVLEPILPSEEIWLRTIRYSLIALTGVFVWPAIFKRARL